jgi:hypothetical protein
MSSVIFSQIKLPSNLGSKAFNIDFSIILIRGELKIKKRFS